MSPKTNTQKRPKRTAATAKRTTATAKRTAATAKRTAATAKRTAATAKRTTAAEKSSSGFTAEERAAMKERVQELKAERGGKADGESEVLAKIAAMGESDRAMAERFHAIVKASAPELVPRTWYGMPAYAKDGKVICYFRDARKFKTRYATLGFSDKANLDEGEMWPTDFAVKEINADVEARVTALVKQAVS